MSHPAVTPLAATASDVTRIIDEIGRLLLQLPDTIPLGQPAGKLYQTMMNVHGEDTWHTFNRRFDILFGEDCRDAEGGLLNISRGQYGLEAVYTYLRSMLGLAVSEGSGSTVPWDAMQIKVERLQNELRRLV